MTIAAAAAVVVVLAALSVFQVLLIFGAPLGRFAWSGQHRVLPTRLRIGSAVSMAVYAVLTAIILARTDLLATGVPQLVVRTAAWFVAGFFLLGIGSLAVGG